MHGYYLHYRNIYDRTRKQTGMDLKVKDQIDAFNDAGISCDFMLCKQPETVPAMVASCLPFFPDGVQWPSIADVADADFLYIRQPRFVSKEMLSFLEEFSVNVPDARVIYEVPTYPYDDPLKTIKTYAALIKDRKHRARLAEYVDRIADLSNTEEIFDIPTIQFSNGINLKRVERKKVLQSDDVIHIMCVAYYGDWHAMDRMIEGLHRYYEGGGTRKIMLHLAGAGDKLQFLKNLVSKRGLEHVVLFPGVLAGKELDELYARCSFAVGALGFHRYGEIVAASLKTREYLAKGIPFIYSGKVDVFQQEPLGCCLEVPADDSPIDIHRFTDFYDSLFANTTEDEVVEKVRSYAERHISMNVSMTNIVEYLNDQVEGV